MGVFQFLYRKVSFATAKEPLAITVLLWHTVYSTVTVPDDNNYYLLAIRKQETTHQKLNIGAGQLGKQATTKIAATPSVSGEKTFPNSLLLRMCRTWHTMTLPAVIC